MWVFQLGAPPLSISQIVMSDPFLYILSCVILTTYVSVLFVLDDLYCKVWTLKFAQVAHLAGLKVGHYR